MPTGASATQDSDPLVRARSPTPFRALEKNPQIPWPFDPSSQTAPHQLNRHRAAAFSPLKAFSRFLNNPRPHAAIRGVWRHVCPPGLIVVRPQQNQTRSTSFPSPEIFERIAKMAAHPPCISSRDPNREDSVLRAHCPRSNRKFSGPGSPPQMDDAYFFLRGSRGGGCGRIPSNSRQRIIGCGIIRRIRDNLSHSSEVRSFFPTISRGATQPGSIQTPTIPSFSGSVPPRSHSPSIDHFLALPYLRENPSADAPA